MTQRDPITGITTPATVATTEPADYLDGIVTGIDLVAALFDWRKQHATHNHDELAAEVRAFIEAAAAGLNDGPRLNGKDRRAAAVGALQALAHLVTAALQSPRIGRTVQRYRRAELSVIAAWNDEEHEARKARAISRRKVVRA